MLSIEWNRNRDVRHVATFVRSAAVGVRVVVDSFKGDSKVPFKVSTGPRDIMVDALLDPAGDYRLGALIGKTLREMLDRLLDAQVAIEVSDSLGDDGQQNLVVRPLGVAA